MKIGPDWPAQSRGTPFSTLFVAHSNHTYFDLPALSFPENLRPITPPVHLGYRTMPAPNDPPVYSALPEFTHAVDSATNTLRKLELCPSAIPPTSDQWHSSPISPHFLPPDNESLSIPAIHLPAPPTPMLSADHGPIHGGFWDCFIKRDNGRCVCTWSEGFGEICGYMSHFGLVK